MNNNDGYNNYNNYENYNTYDNYDNNTHGIQDNSGNYNSNYNNEYIQYGSNTSAIIGLIFSFIQPMFGLIFSIVGYSKSKNMNGSGKGIAIAGIIVSVLEILVSIIFFIVIFGMIYIYGE